MLHLAEPPLPGPSRLPAVTFFSPSLSNFVETMACFMAADPALRVRVVTSLDRGAPGAEHCWCLERLLQNETIAVTDLAAPPESSRWLLFGLSRKPQHPALRAWIDGAEQVAVHPTNYYPRRSDWWIEWARSTRDLRRADMAIFERGPRWFDPAFGCRRRLYWVPYAHPKYLTESASREMMFAPPPAARRRFRLGFMGNSDPPERAERLRAARRGTSAAVSESYDAPAANARVLWLENGEGSTSRRLEGAEYAAALAEMDFCISPPGWGGNWTHRTVEAILRGAIPVIEDPEHYNLGLRDGETCIVADPRDYGVAARRCMEIGDDVIARMRGNLERLRHERLQPDVAAAHFRAHFSRG